MKIKDLLKIDEKIVLASKSPRRIHLLGLLGLDFEVMPAGIDEDIFDGTTPQAAVEKLARLKAENIAKKLEQGHLVIGSDTTVVLEGEVLNKPADKEDAFLMLRKLSGKTHHVLTGISIVYKTDEGFASMTSHEKTEVTFRLLGDDEINAYIETGSPLDKAGAYGIQDDFGAVFVSTVNGCYYNIVGLPLQLLYLKLIEFQKKYL